MSVKKDVQKIRISVKAFDHRLLDDAVRNQLDLLTKLTLHDSSAQCLPKIIDRLQGIKIVAVSAGHRHSMFLDEHGNLYTCGDGSGGALGHGNLEKQHYPMMVTYFGKFLLVFKPKL